MNINIKASVAMAMLAVATVGVSACGSSASKAGAAGAPTSVAGSASSATTSPVTAPSTSDPAAASTSSPTSATSSTSSTNPANPANPASPPARPPAHTDIPSSATLLLGDLAPSSTGPWKQNGGPAVPASQIVDPDNCDPVARPQNVDPKYPRNPAWVSSRNVSWTGSLGLSQVGETVVTYTSAAAASADFAKHRGWVADCAANFQWTDKPEKYSISNAQLNGVPDSYAIRVAMDPPDQPASSAGSDGIDYMAVVLRGNSLTVLDVSDSGSETSKDPGLSTCQHDVQAAAAKLGAVYAPSH